MKKGIKIFIAVVLTVAIVFIAVNAITTYVFTVDIAISKPMDRSRSYMCTPMAAAGYVTNEQKIMMKEFSETIGDYKIKFYEENKDNIYKIDCEVEVKRDKTIVKFFGNIDYVNEGHIDNYNHQIVFDFVFAKNLIGETVK